MLKSLIGIPGYRIHETIYTSSRTVVYRGWREWDQTPVVIKLLKTAYPSLVELAQFKNQYAIAQSLNMADVVRFYSLETYQNQLALIMEDFGGISLKEYTALWGQQSEVSTSLHKAPRYEPLFLTEFLQIAIALAQSLNNLYCNRIIHKDIKPANILIHPTTKQIKLIDFSIASLLPRETQLLINPSVLEGTLEYLSPEQTGRMNRGIDYRTDFYSLGITFYELLTGQLPFQSDDALELVHCHIAKQAPAVHNLNPAVPPLLSEVVSKLMAKNAEDRYQTAWGLKHDLETCLHQWNATAIIVPFKLGHRDTCDRFVIPEKLYGREAEVTMLLEAFERVQQGATELMLVAGFSGVGKTAVVHEVHKLIVRQHGYFIKGKFDQFQRNIPFSALVQAFRDLMGQLLTESDTQIDLWKTNILAALGENSQVIVEVIPELQRIIGEQSPASELSGSAAQNRFNLLFQKFIQVFTTQDHPLVVFLDDLQWADSASLKLMQLLMSEAKSHYLLLVGAYRDNEVSPAHPLMQMIEELLQASVTVNKIALAPLTPIHLNYLIADTLNASPEQAISLTKLVHQKTQGNPFFSNQFIKSLYDDGLIIFDTSVSGWHYDIAPIRAMSLIEDVVEFVAKQLQKLSLETQNVLKLAACIGNQFDLETLAIVYEQSPTETAAALWQALKEGVILPNGEGYKLFPADGWTLVTENAPIPSAQEKPIVSYSFLHDRVQQAAYSLIPDDDKQATHLKIGQRLLNNVPEAEREANVFEIVNHLNIGIELMRSQDDGLRVAPVAEQLAQLNLIAGRKALASTAYKAAIEYLTRGIRLLRLDCWHRQYGLTLSLHKSAAEAAYLCGAYEQMEQLGETVMRQAKTLLDRVGIYDIKIQAYTAQNNVLAAIAIARQAMAQFGLVFPLEPTPADIQAALQETAVLLGGRNPEELVDLPMMTAADKLAVVQIVASVAPAVYIAAPNLFPLLILSQVKASIQYGNAPFSAFCYACYGILLNGILEDVEVAARMGKLALELNAKLNINVIKPTVLYVVGAFIIYLKSHLQNAVQLMLEGYKIALDTGNSYYLGFNAKDICQYSYFLGRELPRLEEDMQAYNLVLENFQQTTTLNYCRIYHQAVLNLLGKAENACVLTGKALNEEELLPQLIAANEFTGLHYFYVHKLILCYLFGDLSLAIATATQARQYLGAGTGYATIPVFQFYDSLTALAAYPTATPFEQAELLQRVTENQQKMQTWASHAPMNYLHKFELVAAERCRVLGQTAVALDHYDRAIAAAKANEYTQEEALANELAARFYLDWGKEAIAQVYLTNAYYAYGRWGAKAKLDDLEHRYPQLLAPIVQGEDASSPLRAVRSTTTGAGRSSSSISEALDLATVIKASHALAGEIELEKLLSTLMQVVVENAGAEKCVLLLRHEENWVIAAQTATNVDLETPLEVGTQRDQLGENSAFGLRSQPLRSSRDIPHSVVNYVSRTAEPLVLDDARLETTFADDPYMILQQPKSLLCMPICNRGKLIGMVYLENNLTIAAFTRNCLEVLRLLTAQAAISLQNAMLYNKLAVAKVQLEKANHTLEKRVEQRTQELHKKNQHLSATLEQLQRTQTQLIQTEKMSGLGQLVAGVAHEINNPVNFIYGNLIHTAEYTGNLLDLVELYQQTYPATNRQIEEKVTEIDLDFLIEDLPKILSSMKVGADRIRQIVLSLRNFSRLDEAEMKPVDIHEGIDSTLMILQNRLKAKPDCPAIEVIKEYGDLPRVECYASQLNQVFMNILANALDALNNYNAQRSAKDALNNPSCITIRTKLLTNNTQPSHSKRVVIQIQDNGSGMTQEVRQQLFDPFFTTKPIGQGTGLGLSISYQIVVAKHGGSLECFSEPGRGAEFWIEIPVDQSSSNCTAVAN
ncbi:MAG: AAA family ATPase [Microcoleus sp.]